MVGAYWLGVAINAPEPREYNAEREGSVSGLAAIHRALGPIGRPSGFRVSGRAATVCQPQPQPSPPPPCAPCGALRSSANARVYSQQVLLAPMKLKTWFSSACAGYANVNW